MTKHDTTRDIYKERHAMHRATYQFKETIRLNGQVLSSFPHTFEHFLIGKIKSKISIMTSTQPMITLKLYTPE